MAKKKSGIFGKIGRVTGISEIPSTFGDLSRQLGLTDFGAGAYDAARRVSKTTGLSEVPSALGDLGAYLFDWNPRQSALPLKGPPNQSSLRASGVEDKRNYNIPYVKAPKKPTVTVKPATNYSSLRAKGLEEMPTPLGSSTTPGLPVPQTTADQTASIMELLKQFNIPGTTDKLNISMPDLPTVDMMPIYQKYSPIAGQIYDQLNTTLAGMKTGMEQNQAANLAGMQEAYGRVGADIEGQAAKSKAGYDEMIQRLGMGEMLTRPSYTGYLDTAQRLKGLSDISEKTGLETLRQLGGVQATNFDTLQQMGAGQKSKSLFDMLQGNMGAQAEADMSRATTMGELAKIISQGQSDYQNTLLNLRGKKMDENLALLKFALDQRAAQDANKPDDPFSGTETTTETEQPFFEAIQQYTAQNPVAAALWDKMYKGAGMDLGATAKALSDMTSRVVTTPPNSFVGGGGTMFNTGASYASGGRGGEPNRELLEAQQLLNLMTNLGAMSGKESKRTTTLKAPGMYGYG